jgi:hypothetical protein
MTTRARVVEPIDHESAPVALGYYSGVRAKLRRPVHRPDLENTGTEPMGNPLPARAGRARFSRGARSSHDTVSVGWGEEFASTMASQHLDVTDVADGDYIVLLEADLGNEFLEVDEHNNACWAVITISGDKVTVVSSATEVVED